MMLTLAVNGDIIVDHPPVNESGTAVPARVDGDRSPDTHGETTPPAAACDTEDDERASAATDANAQQRAGNVNDGIEFIRDLVRALR
jgi:hypothetical protein